MQVRKFALALLAMGLAACSHSQSAKAGGANPNSEGTAAAAERSTGTTPDTASRAETDNPQGGTQPQGSSATSGSSAGTSTSGGNMTGSGTGSGAMGSSSGMSGQIISGKATKVSMHSLSIQTDAGTRETLAVAPETIITVDGRDGRLSDITLGTDVRASYNELEGKKVAIKLDANRAGASGSSGMGTSGSSGTGTSGSTDTSGSGTSTAPDTSGSGSTGATQPGTESPSTGR